MFAEIVVVWFELGVMVKFNFSVTQFVVVPVYNPELVYVVPFQVYVSQAVILVTFSDTAVSLIVTEVEAVHPLASVIV